MAYIQISYQMKKQFVLVLQLITCGLFSQAPVTAKQPLALDKPKLIVAIVVDQMRYDYIYKYWEKLGTSGFKRLLGEGFNCKNTQYNYMPTFTGPGHASIYTGTTPSIHGIIANQWYSKERRKMVYCSEDTMVKNVGGSAREGRMSPKNMLSTTFGDELRLFSNFGSRVFGIALKDRGAILPAGHTGNAAYWFDPNTGHWMSSTHYMQTLPAWVAEFNKKDLVKSYLAKEWNTLLPIEKYTESLSDNNPYEIPFQNETTPTFPHKLPELVAKGAGPGLIRSTPYGSNFTKDFAIDLIKNEKLGKGAFTDVIAISFSSPDLIGHQFGPQSIEVEDCYLRLDKDIEDLLKFLDTWLGKNNVLLFLTADHAAVDVPSYLSDKKIPSGYYTEDAIHDSLRKFCIRHFGDTLVSNVSNYQVFLNEKKLAITKIDRMMVQNKIAAYLLTLPGISESVPAHIFALAAFNEKPRSIMQAGYYAKRSGDVLFNYSPGWIEHDKRGTTHGSPYSYDTRVPLIWYGWGIKKGSSSELVNIIDIAPTISVMLNTNFPNGCTGKPINFTGK